MSLTPRLDSIQRNHLINAAFLINQRFPLNPSVGLTTGKVTYIDRYSSYCQGSTTKNFTISQSTDVPTLVQSGNVVSSSFYLSNGTGFTVADVDDLVQPFYYIVEGYDYQRLHGKVCTLGFWFKASVTGNYGISFTGARFYVTTFNVPVANVWQWVTLTIQLDTATGWSFDNSSGLAILIGCIGGTDFVVPTQNQWITNSGFPVVPSNATPWHQTTGATIQVAMPSFVEGNSLDPFSFHASSGSFANELNACLRYCYAPSYNNPAPGGGFMPAYGINNTFAAMGNFPCVMRTAPTFNDVSTYIDFTPASGGSIPMNNWTGDTRTSPVGYYITGILQSALSPTPVGGILTTILNAASMIFDAEL